MKPPPVPPTGPRRAPVARARRARPIALGLAVLVAVGALAGCQVDNTPKGYDASDGIVRRNFIATCTGNIPNQSTTSVVASEPFCGCAFDVFKAKVPYNADDRSRVAGYPADKPTFQDLEGHLGGDAGRYDELPREIRDEIQHCNQVGQSGPVAPTGSAPAGSTSTTGTAAP